MAGSPLGPAAQRVAENLRRIRQERGLSYAELSRRLEKTGHPIRDTGLLKIEKGDRGIGVDDLAALAVALGTTPNRLLLPDMKTDSAEGDCEITPGVAAPASLLWAWAQGEVPLGRSPSSPDDSRSWRREEFIFIRENRQYHSNAPQQAPPGSRDKAVAQLLAKTGIVKLVQEEFTAGMTTADIRAVFESALGSALQIPDPASESVRIEFGDGKLTIFTRPPDALDAEEA